MFNSIKLASKAIRRNKVRTGLTTLGIVIGVGAVILVLSAGAGFEGFINAQVDAYGTNTIFVETRVPPTAKARESGTSSMTGDIDRAMSSVVITSLKDSDIEDIKRLPNVATAYGIAADQKVVSFQDQVKIALIFGTGTERFDMDTTKLVEGRPFTEAENLSVSQVAIIGNKLAKDLFGQNDPVGKQVKVKDLNFEIVGVYEEKGSMGGMDTDNSLFVPLKTAQKKLLGIDYLLMILVQAKDKNLSSATAEDIRLTLRDNHQIKDAYKDDFNVMTAAEGLDIFNSIFAGITFLLISIAAISLVVGGVGIMNIMYVIVTERTSEIGLKKALGAKNRDIRTEFLAEAIFITVIGGIVGILLGAFLSFILSLIAKTTLSDWAFVLPLNAVIIAISVSASIGLIFGVLPATRAAKLDPIEALRYE
ncbi:MAG: ABC transporter permease [Acidobacteriaceae bacterium]